MRLAVLIAVLSVIQAGPQGTATVTLTGADLNVSGDFPTARCGSAYLLGKGMVYQVKAGDYQITIASEARASGAVPLNEKGGAVNVVATVTGKGRNFARYPANGGTLTVSSDYRKAEAALELRNVVGKDTAKLAVTFVCK